MTSPILEARGVRVEYGGRVILDVPRLSIEAGETLVIIGPNGAGKSTLMRILAFLEAPISGEVRFQGQTVPWRLHDLLSVRRKFASVFQEPLLCDATVEKNVSLGLRLRGTKASEARPRAIDWMERLGIAKLATRSVRTLSFGEAHRTSLARALATDPEVLFLDEAFAALDLPSRERLLSDFQTVMQETKTTAIIITQDQNEALRLGDRVAILMDGRVQQLGQPLEVFRKPASERTARFVGIDTPIPGHVRASDGDLLVVECAAGQLKTKGKAVPGEKVLVCVRPEEITLRLQGQNANERVDNTLTGRVTGLRPTGTHVRLSLDCGHPLVALASWRSISDLRIRDGSEIVVTFAADAAHVIPQTGNSNRS